MKSPGVLSFDNTAFAFAYKSDQELKQAHWLFRMMGINWLVQMGTRLTPWAIRVGLPVKGLIRKTLFSQFVGGETLEQTAEVAKMLDRYQVQVILDYGVEGGNDGEPGYDHARDEFIRVIRYAATQPNIPFMSIKVTGLCRFGLLEKLDALASERDGFPHEAALLGNIMVEGLTEEERAEWDRVVGRMNAICEVAASSGVGVLVDAEETWIQDPVDALTMKMMERYNRGRVVVFNTIQLYRHDRLAFLKQSVSRASSLHFLMGAKIVRGAYMEKERKRAEEMGYASPIQPSKEASDRDYNAALKFAIENIEGLSLIIASHNEQSNLLAVQLLDEHGLSHDHPHIHFSQLYGMSDNITFNLAHAGCKVSKYLPFGPLEDVVPYLMRRAQENTSVKGQTGRELALIEKELKRRKT